MDSEETETLDILVAAGASETRVSGPDSMTIRQTAVVVARQMRQQRRHTPRTTGDRPDHTAAQTTDPAAAPSTMGRRDRPCVG